MGCLIEFKYTKKASEKPSFSFLGVYEGFFRNSTIVYKELEGEHLILRIYVHCPENKASDFIVNSLQHDRQFQKVRIVS